MSNVLLTKQGDVIDCLSGATHEVTCVHLLNQTVNQFILNGGVRIKQANESLAIESDNPLTTEQLLHVNKILRTNNIYYVITTIESISKEKQSYRPIRGLPAELR